MIPACANVNCGDGTCTAPRDDIYLCLCSDGSYKVNSACCPEFQNGGMRKLSNSFNGLFTLVVSGTETGTWTNGLYGKCRSYQNAPEQRHGPEQKRMAYIPIFQVLKLFQVVCFNNISMAFRCPVLVPDTVSVNNFCILSVQVPVPVLDTASVITP